MMNSRYRMTVFLGILTLLFLGSFGCGEKRLHVATTTGNPGPSKEQGGGQESIQPEQTGLGSNTGLSEERLGREAEQKLPGEGPGKITLVPTLPSGGKLPQKQVGKEVKSSALPSLTSQEPPASPIAESYPASPPQTVGQAAKAPGASGGEPVYFAHKPSSPQGGQAKAPGASGGEPVYFAHKPSSPQGGQTKAPGASGGEPIHFAHEPSFPQTGLEESGKAAFQEQAQSLPRSSNPRLPGRLPVETIPENITVAKVEPTAIPKQQLEKIQEKELAAAAEELKDVFFAFDSWGLVPEGRQALEENATQLKAEPSAHLLIEGHCDERGTQAYNMALGKRRASVIHDYLVDLGVNPSRLTVVSYGKERPFCTDSTEECYQLNRRGHMLVQERK